MTVKRSDAPKATGRLPAKIDMRQLEVLARIQCTFDEIGAVLGISSKTVQRRFGRQIKEWREGGKTSIRRAQYTMAVGTPAQIDEKTGKVIAPPIPPNPTMLIWLGKQMLGQKDMSRQEFSDPNGKPLPQSKVTVEFVRPAKPAQDEG